MNLQAVRDLRERIEELEEKLLVMKARATSPRTPKLDCLPRSGGTNDERNIFQGGRGGANLRNFRS